MTDDRSTMRAEAVDAMAQRDYEDIHQRGQMASIPWDSDNPVMEGLRESYRKRHRAALDALLSPQSVPCSECGGTGTVDSAGQEGLAECPARCDHGQVSSPPLAVLMGETAANVMAQAIALNSTLATADRVALNDEEAAYVAAAVLDALRSGESSPNTEEGST